jgi:microsomal epoxide hydrolase
MDQDWLKDFCAYWVNEYRWQDTVDELHRFAHFTAEIDGLDIHFIREDGSGDNPEALLMTHGWPGSVYEFIEVIDRLAHPENYGGKAEDGVTVICPSLPGYGFSAAPPRPIGQVTTAALWDKLMREALGFDTYIAQGGDWGSVVTSLLGLHHSVEKGGGCKAIHINMYGLRSDAAPQTPEEENWLAEAQAIMQAESAYLQVQVTKPQTLAYAMSESPVGAAAWILEKFYTWSDLPLSDGKPDMLKRYSRHALASNLMIYLMTDSFMSAIWFYRGFAEEMPHIPPGEKIAVPVGVGKFADTYLSFPPRRMMEDSYHITHWAEFTDAGHFAAMENPAQFAGAVLDFIATL